MLFRLHEKLKIKQCSVCIANAAGLALKNPLQKNPPNKTKKKKHLKNPSPVWVFLGFISFYSKYVLSTNYV